MIHWSRQKLSFNLVDHSLVTHEKQRAVEYFSSRNGGRRGAFGFRSCREIPGFMDMLSRAFSNKCVYCERVLGKARDRELSLIRPSQLECEHSEKPGQDHYWWLNWEWSNLVLTCHQCNWNKGASFPIAGSQVKVGGRGLSLQNEKPLLLDPCLDFPDEHLLFKDDGEVVAADGSIEGRTTIDILDLNRSELVQARRIEADKLQKIVDLTHRRDHAKLFKIESSDHKQFSCLRKQILGRAFGDEISSTVNRNVGNPLNHKDPDSDSTVVAQKLVQTIDAAALGHDDFINRILEDRWHVEKLIGKGGMGKVYLARDMRLSMRKVVVKIPDAKLLRLQAIRNLFEKEVDILIEHLHPSIVKVEDRGDVEGMPFVVLQYLAGGNLKDLAKKRKGIMAVQDVFQWLFPVARALDFLHGGNTLHRDVKPGNILFDTSGHAFLADFGIAKVLGQKESKSLQSVSISGTVKYMAPDSELTPAYDQYSLGLVVFEALTGKVPNSKNRAQGLTRDPIPNVSEGVRNVLIRVLNPEPMERFESCLAFAHGLKRAI